MVIGEIAIPAFLESTIGGVALVEPEEEAKSEREPEMSTPPARRRIRSPQLLRFSAHLALVIAAQCPYLVFTGKGAQEAVEDVVCAYAEHLAKTQQVRQGSEQQTHASLSFCVCGCVCVVF